MKPHAFVPLVTYPDANAEAVAANAVALAALIDADIHAVAINPDIPDISNALSKLLLDTPELIRAAEATSRQSGKRLLELIGQEAAAAGVEATTLEVVVPLTELAEAAAMHARYFDLSLIGWEAGNSASRMTAEAVIFGSGRPAILLPEMLSVSSIDHVAIAWDGSRVAARAVADAQIFLERSTRISILTVLDEKPLTDKDAGERLREALHRRGLDAQVVPINAEDCPIAETLQQLAIERGARLLVMGGYGHSRMRDFVLGGATNGVLGDLLMPVLLSH